MISKITFCLETATSKSVRSDHSHSNTRPSQPAHSTSDYSTDTTSRLKAPTSSSYGPSTNNSFHNSLKKPVLKKIPITQLDMDPEHAVAVSTPVMERATMPRSKSQLMNKSAPVGNTSDSLLNGNAQEQQDNSADLIQLSDASTVSPLLELPAARLANRSKPKIVFEKVAGTDSNDVDRQKQGKSEQSFGVWHQRLDKFIQESSV